MVHGECVRGGCQREEFPGFLGNKGVVSWGGTVSAAGLSSRLRAALSAERDSVSALTCLCRGEALGPTPSCHRGKRGVGPWGQRSGCLGGGGEERALVAPTLESAPHELGCLGPFPGVRPRSAAPRGAQGSCRSFSPLSPPVLPPGLWAGWFLSQGCLPSLCSPPPPRPPLPAPQLHPRNPGSFPDGSHGQER